MNINLKINPLRAFFIVIITGLYIMVCENDLCSAIDYSNTFHSESAECIAQPKIFKPLENNKKELYLKPHKTYLTFYYTTVHHYRKQLLSTNTFDRVYSSHASTISFTVHPIISILQKSNTWHRSSDDDPFHRVS